MTSRYRLRLRPHFHSIYAYCRISDDLGDEVGDTAQSLALLDLWGEELERCYQGEARHPVFVALRQTIAACDIPQEPFADLLVAFRQDQIVTRYQTMAELLAYWIRHQWTVCGGQASNDTMENFVGYLELCLANSGF